MTETETSGLTNAHDNPEVLRSLLQVGVNLTAIEDLAEMLELILQELRKIAHAEAGSLYILRKGGSLRLAVAQNDRLASTHISSVLLNREFPISNDSLVGHVAVTREAVNIPDSYTLLPGTPFRINRECDAATGYKVKSILAIPLQCPDGRCIGVLELFNRIGDDGKVSPFPDAKCGVILSLTSMAAVTIHNAMLREELKRANLDTIIRLSVAAELRDNETASHVRRISLTSSLIAEAMGMTPKQVDVVRLASAMHDVGKIGIPDSILRKPGCLTDDERQIIEDHPLIATEILGDPLNDLVDAARVVALTHHERWDGEGYPNGLAGEDIPLIGRIVGLVDVFDALVSERCYKEAMPLDQALGIVRDDSGKHFDPKVVDTFFDVLDEVLVVYRDPANAEGTASLGQERLAPPIPT